MNKFFLNPFLIISFTYLLSLSLYLLPFSTIYPTLTLVNVGPVIFFIGLNLCLSLLWYIYGFSSFNFNSINIQPNDQFIINADRIFYTLICIAIIEFLIYGVPLFGMVNYFDFGVPILHVILISAIMLSSIISSLFITTKKNKIIFISCLMISFLILNRFVMLIIVLALFFSYIIMNKISIRKLILTVSCLAVFLVIFGELGLYRTMLLYDISYEQASQYILDAGFASDVFKETGLFASIFWFWLYLTSPISNLLHNINIMHDYSLLNVGNMYLYEILPETISKRIGNNPFTVDLITNNLNATTSIAAIYNSSWYVGIFIYVASYSAILFICGSLFKNIRGLVFVIFCSVYFMFMVFYNVVKMPIFMFTVILLCSTSFSWKK
jgi:hypothetical protein